ncbi:RpiB/LacA/LacB family sugar-phosphate isomerase, partial [Alicyclobacillaceae bacterium I2511]
MGGIHLKIAIGSDHAGFHLKEHLKQVLDEFGAEYEDMGTFNEDSVDYPDYAKKVAVAVASGQFERGVLLCGTGLGMCISANKIAGIRAVTVQDEFSARLSREH